MRIRYLHSGATIGMYITWPIRFVLSQWAWLQPDNRPTKSVRIQHQRQSQWLASIAGCIRPAMLQRSQLHFKWRASSTPWDSPGWAGFPIDLSVRFWLLFFETDTSLSEQIYSQDASLRHHDRYYLCPCDGHLDPCCEIDRKLSTDQVSSVLTGGAFLCVIVSTPHINKLQPVAKPQDNVRAVLYTSSSWPCLTLCSNTFNTWIDWCGPSLMPTRAYVPPWESHFSWCWPCPTQCAPTERTCFVPMPDLNLVLTISNSFPAQRACVIFCLIHLLLTVFGMPPVHSRYGLCYDSNDETMSDALPSPRVYALCSND